jgi:hypothetical protein
VRRDRQQRLYTRSSPFYGSSQATKSAGSVKVQDGVPYWIPVRQPLQVADNSDAWERDGRYAMNADVQLTKVISHVNRCEDPESCSVLCCD